MEWKTACILTIAHNQMPPARRRLVPIFVGIAAALAWFSACERICAPPPVEAELAPPYPIGFEWVEAGCRSDESGESCTLTRYRVVDTVLDIVVERGEDEPVSGSEDGPRRERATWLYRVEATRAAKPRPEDWDDACGDSEFGLFVAGGWDDDGRYDLNGFTFSCLDGAIAKCAYQWGYDPERAVVAEDGALTSLRAVHMACVRAVRADYCGDGTAHTRAGIPIAMTDGLGINTRSSEPDFRPEACFDPDGALWVARARLSNTAQVRGDWLELSNCRRPVQAADAADSVASRAVVCVASHPDG